MLTQFQYCKQMSKVDKYKQWDKNKNNARQSAIQFKLLETNTGISPDSLNNQTLHEEGTFPILVMFPLPPIWTIYLH